MRTRFIISSEIERETLMAVTADGHCDTCHPESPARKYWFTITGAAKAFKRVKKMYPNKFGPDWKITKIDWFFPEN